MRPSPTRPGWNQGAARAMNRAEPPSAIPESKPAAPVARRQTRWYSLALAGVLLISFLVLAGAVIGSAAVTRFDGMVNQAFEPLRTQPWLAILLWLTALGAGPTLVAVMVTASGMLWAHRRTHLLPTLWIAFLGTEAATWTLKFLIGRHRPEFVTAAKASSPSFPSAHAAGSLAVYAAVALVLTCEPLRAEERV